VIEAGGNDPDFDGIIGTGVIMDSDNDGWSNIVDPNNGGTILSDGNIDGDLLKNRVDPDSDGDGCNDVYSKNKRPFQKPLQSTVAKFKMVKSEFKNAVLEFFY